MPNMFEIVYADDQVISGTTEQEFRDARQDGVLFVVVRNDDGSIEKHKGLDVYHYGEASIPGSWATDEVYNDVKSRLHLLTELLAWPKPDQRSRRRRSS